MSREKSRDPRKIANHTNGTTQLSSILKYRRYVSVKISMQNTEEECAPGLLEFETRLTHIFTGSLLSRLYQVQGDRSAGTRKGEKKRVERKKGRGEFRKNFSPRNFHIGNSYFNGGWIFHREKPAARERKNFARVHVARQVTSFSSWIRRCGLISPRTEPRVRIFIPRIFTQIFTR